MPRLSAEQRRIRRLEELLDESLEQLAGTIKDARAFDAVRTAGLLIDKIQLLRGRPTERIEWSSSIDDLKKMIVEAASKRGYRISAAEQRDAENAAIAQVEGQG